MASRHRPGIIVLACLLVLAGCSSSVVKLKNYSVEVTKAGFMPLTQPGCQGDAVLVAVTIANIGEDVRCPVQSLGMTLLDADGFGYDALPEACMSREEQATWLDIDVEALGEPPRLLAGQKAGGMVAFSVPDEVLTRMQSRGQVFRLQLREWDLPCGRTPLPPWPVLAEKTLKLPKLQPLPEAP